MCGKEGVVDGTEQRGELPNSPGGTIKGLWFRKSRHTVRGSSPSQEHPCTWRFLRCGLTHPTKATVYRWGNRDSGTLSLLPKVTEQTGSHPFLSCDLGTDPKSTLREGCKLRSWGDANPSYTESPHSLLETPQEGVGRVSARASDFCRATYERWESKPFPPPSIASRFNPGHTENWEEPRLERPSLSPLAARPLLLLLSPQTRSCWPLFGSISSQKRHLHCLDWGSRWQHQTP